VTASAEEVLRAIKNGLGNPSSGPFVDYWGIIEGAVTEAMTATPPAKETRIIKATETREDATT
jgi:hypothetical protein